MNLKELNVLQERCDKLKRYNYNINDCLKKIGQLTFNMFCLIKDDSKKRDIRKSSRHSKRY